MKNKEIQDRLQRIEEEILELKAKLGEVASPQVESQEVWNEMLNYCDTHYPGDVRVLEYLMKHYHLTRKAKP